MTVHKPSLLQSCKTALYRPYLIFNTVARRKSHKHFFPFEPRPVVERAAIASGPRQQRVPKQQRTSLLHRITPLVSARCLRCTHSFFLSNPLRGRSKYVKSEWYQGALPTCFVISAHNEFYFPRSPTPLGHQTLRTAVQEYLMRNK